MRLHLQNRATHWNEDGTLNLVWCVVTEKGKPLTDWITMHGAETARGKIIARILGKPIKKPKRIAPFFEGTPCSKCNSTLRYKSNKSCISCAKANSKIKHPPKRRTA